MKREDLKKLELSDEAIDAIMKLHGEDINAVKSGVKTSLDAANSETETVQKQLKEANKQIEDFKKLDIEGIQAAADDWKQKEENFQKELDQAKKDAEAQVQQLQFDHALEAALQEAGAKDPADVVPHLKKDMLKLGEDGKFVGLAEQLKPLQESKDYLFESETPIPEIVTGAQGKKVKLDSFTAALRKGAELPPE